MKCTALDCEWVPARRPDAHKLLVVLHGRGDSAAGFRWLPSALELAGVSYLLVNAPDPYFEGRSWYDLPPDQRPGVERSVARLEALFGEILAQGYRAADVGLFGFSQGGLITLEFGGRCELALACYVGVSGYCLDPASLLDRLAPGARRPVWLITHGVHDEVLPFERSAAQALTLRAGGLPVEFRSYAKGHTIDLEQELVDIRGFLRRHLLGEDD
jgi:phospholipase/carboxylesterase